MEVLQLRSGTVNPEFLSACVFRRRQFEPVVIVTRVRWYLRFSLSVRDVEELMAERNLAVDHTTVWPGFRHMRPNFASDCRDS